MKLLAIDASAKTASAAVVEDGRLIGECFINAGLAHSRTLMFMIDNVLKSAELKIDDADAFCVSAGPGSFTGLRIAVSVIKGLAAKDDRPCAGVSSLEAVAYNFTDESGVVCVAMDARRNQVYSAPFRIRDNRVERIGEDGAVSIEELRSELEAYDETVFLAGDGAKLCFDAFGKARRPDARLAAENRRFPRAYGVALAALYGPAEFKSSYELAPVYLRPSQAERELKMRREKK